MADRRFTLDDTMIETLQAGLTELKTVIARNFKIQQVSNPQSYIL